MLRLKFDESEIGKDQIKSVSESDALKWYSLYLTGPICNLVSLRDRAQFLKKYPHPYKMLMEEWFRDFQKVLLSSDGC